MQKSENRQKGNSIWPSWCSTRTWNGKSWPNATGSDGDQYDEVWEGVYIVAPLPSNEHQQFVHRLSVILGEVVDQTGRSVACSPASTSATGMTIGSRTTASPDVAVFLDDGRAIDCGTHWQGPADFLVEIISPGDRTVKNFRSTARSAWWNCLIVDRDPWTLELYRHQNGQLTQVGRPPSPRPTR